MDALQPTLAIAAVLGLLAAVLWWLRRQGMARFAGLPRRNGGVLLERVERLPLAPGDTLHLVRVGDHAVLVATSPRGCHLIESFPWSTVAARAGFIPDGSPAPEARR